MDMEMDMDMDMDMEVEMIILKNGNGSSSITRITRNGDIAMAVITAVVIDKSIKPWEGPKAKMHRHAEDTSHASSYCVMFLNILIVFNYFENL